MLSAGWSAPEWWTNDEQWLFAWLFTGEEADVRPDPKEAFDPAAATVVVHGRFLAEIIRKYAEEFPIGIALIGVRVEDRYGRNFKRPPQSSRGKGHHSNRRLKGLF